MKPYLVIEWQDTETDAKGWLSVFNFVRGFACGGTRMHPSVTKEEVIRLSRAMAHKHKASTFWGKETSGGCKAGISYDYKAPDARAVLRRFLIAVLPYVKTGVFLGADLGTNFDYIMSVFHEHGVFVPQTPWMAKDPVVQQGQKNYDAALKTKMDCFDLIDSITGYGTAFCADEAWNFKDGKSGAKVVIQGFGSVGASCAYKLVQLGYKIVGVADANLLVECQDGLDIEKLIADRKGFGEMDKEKFASHYIVRPNTEWLDVDCDILIPAALEDVINVSNAHKVRASLIVEGANIPISAEGDKIIAERGIDVVNDFVANLGATRFDNTLTFCLIEPDPQKIIDDIEEISRKNTKLLFETAKKEGQYQRIVAEKIFAPTTQDLTEN